jgi:hypothetical protein
MLRTMRTISVLLQEVKQVLFGQLQLLLAFSGVGVVLVGLATFAIVGHRAPQVVEGLVLVVLALALALQLFPQIELGPAAVAEDALIHQRVGAVEQLFDRRGAVLFLALGDVALGEVQVVEDALGVGPLLEQIVVLEEVVVAESRMRHHQRLHRHGVLFHVVADAGVGIDDDLVGQAGEAFAVEPLLAKEALAERPVPVHQRHAVGGVGVEHLLGGDDLDLVGVDIEAEIVERDVLDRVVGPVEQVEVPFRTLEQVLAAGPAVGLLGSRRRVLYAHHLLPFCLANSSRNTG